MTLSDSAGETKLFKLESGKAKYLREFKLATIKL